MDWSWFIFGVLLGSLITSVLIWTQRRMVQQELPPDYFNRVAMSVALTAILASIVRVGIDYASTSSLNMTGILFGGGWLLGGLLAGWFLSRSAQRP